MCDLSIIIPTCNRAELLERGLASLRDDVRCSFEVIVVDGASEDRTPEVLGEAKKFLGDRLRVIREEKREGFVRAANKGFCAAVGRNMMWLNDDARPLRGALDEAVRQMDCADKRVAFLALFHRYASQRNIAYEATNNGRTYRLCHVRGTLYANFAIGRRETFERLGCFDERYYFYAADPDLSLKAWNTGMRVEPAFGCFVEHDEHEDSRRVEDSDRGKADNEKLLAKWVLPERNVYRNDFDPARPCTVRGLREGGGERAVVSFVISTHNRRESLLETLGNLKEPSSETIVVDNASTDGTADAVAETFPAVKVIKLRKNRGACAKNLAIAAATGQFIVFLDDDSYPTGASIPRMIEHFRADERLGAAVFKVVLPDGSRESSAYPNVFIGCGTGFRREALAEAGGLPDDFFMQAEEYDLSLRLMDAGWEIRRFEDLCVNHRKDAAARRPTRTTRLDARNNLLVIARRFPRKWRVPFAMDWMRRYRWIAQSKGWQHSLAFWRGVIEGMVRSLLSIRGPGVSEGAFERFAMIERIRAELAETAARGNIHSILLVDVGKNILPFLLAARECGLKIVAVADQSLARAGRRYRGIAVVDDATARGLKFDAAVVTNISPVQGAKRAEEWRKFGSLVIEVGRVVSPQAIAA